jgi:hypothetical protein
MLKKDLSSGNANYMQYIEITNEFKLFIKDYFIVHRKKILLILMLKININNNIFLFKFIKN